MNNNVEETVNYAFQLAVQPKIITSPPGRFRPHVNRWFLWPNRVSVPNGISIGSAVLAGLKNVTNRQTDRPR